MEILAHDQIFMQFFFKYAESANLLIFLYASSNESFVIKRTQE